MKVRLVVVKGPGRPILVSPGFRKKDLSTYHLEVLIKCGLSCRYCSTNKGRQARVHGEERDLAAYEQLGIRLKAGTEPRLALWDPQIIDNLVAQFEDERPDFGAGGTLMFSQFTDPFSVPALPLGITRAALELVFERTRFRVRVLTKNASVGGKEWLELFIKHRDRVVVGLSIGTLDDVWAKKMEVDTSPPSARIHALHRLQDAGVPTFGMLCPIFPEVMEGDRLERLVEATRPPLVEHLWAEPFNDRSNWMNVRDAYKLGTDGYQWMTDVFDTQGGKRKRNVARWSGYATQLYERLLAKAERDGWIEKLKYLLYEEDIVATDAPRFSGLKGLLLQSKPADDGRSKNGQIAKLQTTRTDLTTL